jgi:hypothetical protein
MELLVNLWFVWLLGMLVFAAYTVINQMDRIAAILARINLTLKEIAPLFFNGRKFTLFVISAFIAFGFFILFSVSLFINIMQAIKLSVKLF